MHKNFSIVKSKTLDNILPLYIEYLDYYQNRYGHELYSDCSSDIDRKKKINELIKSDLSTFFEAVSDDNQNRRYGFVHVYHGQAKSGNSDWRIKDLFVSPKCRRMGVASSLVQAAIDFVADKNGRTLSLLTGKINTQASALYEKIGFKLDPDYTGDQNVQYVVDL